MMNANVEHLAEGRIDGRIIEEPRGRNGFGYDPLFVPKGYRQTFAEMESSLKNTLSHRAQALAKMREILSRYYRAQ